MRTIEGYGAYTRYANKTGIASAQCWAHTCRKLFEARGTESEAATWGLDMIDGPYAVEATIREQKLNAAQKLNYRLMDTKPLRSDDCNSG